MIGAIQKSWTVSRKPTDVAMPTNPLSYPAHTDAVPTLVAQVFDEAPPAVRRRLLEHLLKPLGVLSLVAVANGVFAQLAQGKLGYSSSLRADEVRRINPMDVMALVNHVQQVSVHAVDSLASVISASPVLTSSATAAMLLTILTKQAQSRPPVLSNDFDPLV
jgi:hypothetical protein